MTARDRGPRCRCCSFGQTPALRGAVGHGERRRDPGHHGTQRLGQVDAAALPGRDPARPTPGRSTSTASGSTRWPSRRRSELRRDHFGFVFQFGQLVPELTAEENVALPLLLGGGRRRAAMREAATWFDRLAGRAGAPPHRRAVRRPGAAGRRWPGPWSTGRRWSSPTSRPASLDSLTGELVMDLLVGSAREEGTTVILVTHEAPGGRLRRPRGHRTRRQDRPAPAGRPMIRLGVRLALAGGREAVSGWPSSRRRSALGVGLLLGVVAGINAVNRRTPGMPG